MAGYLTVPAFIKKRLASLVSHIKVLVSPNVLGVGVLLLLAEICALSVVYASYQSRALFSELEVLRRQSEDMQSVWTQLLLEHSTLTAFQRVAERAGNELNMRVPNPRDVVVLQHDS
jgi:cell division protein FtsL